MIINQREHPVEARNIQLTLWYNQRKVTYSYDEVANALNALNLAKKNRACVCGKVTYDIYVDHEFDETLIIDTFTRQ